MTFLIKKKNFRTLSEGKKRIWGEKKKTEKERGEKRESWGKY